MYISFTMSMHIILVLPFLLQMSSGRPQQQSQLVTQMLPPNQASALGPEALGPMHGPAASLGQILVNLLNYKLQWLNQLAGHFTGVGPSTHSSSIKPSLLGALGALGAPQAALPAAGVPGTTHFAHPHHGYPFMTTLVTTLSGNAPTVPGITISGAPVNHLGNPGFYPGAPTTTPPQDFHWVPPFAPEPPQVAQPPAAVSTPLSQPAPAVSQPAAPQPAAPSPLAQPPQPTPQNPSIVPVIPAVDDVPIVQTVVQPSPAAPGPSGPAVAAPAAVPVETRF